MSFVFVAECTKECHLCLCEREVRGKKKERGTRSTRVVRTHMHARTHVDAPPRTLGEGGGQAHGGPPPWATDEADILISTTSKIVNY